jgi:hypothetical protein
MEGAFFFLLCLCLALWRGRRREKRRRKLFQIPSDSVQLLRQPETNHLFRFTVSRRRRGRREFGCGLDLERQGSGNLS